jgi:ppGpp synthetase/RelA/SpoT-type nucleotidyltranferase
VLPPLQPGPHTALFAMTSLLTLALSAGGIMYYGARSAWERVEPWVTGGAGTTATTVEEQETLFGVDVTGSRFFNRPAVLRAVEFAAEAHKDQFRKTQEPYVAHCVATAAIVERLLAPTEDDARAEAAVIAALLHDVMDDAGVGLDTVEAAFGGRVAGMVSRVSQLSATNQLVRRRLRLNAAESTPQEAAQLRHMILTMVSEPLVIVVKLADRLHNMRTVYALPPDKQRAVAEETRRVWCSLAERLGMFALKSELEDLCFAVLQPTEYRALRAELDELWGLVSIPPAAMEPTADTWEMVDEGEGDERGLEARSGGAPGWLGAAHAALPGTHADSPKALHHIEPPTLPADSIETAAGGDDDDDADLEAPYLTTEQLEVRGLVRSVLPFDASTFNMERLTIPPSARRGLEVLQGCARALLQEITLEGVASGLDVSVQGRVKSLYSTFRKMARKGVPLREVYDARALRVVVEDAAGARERDAIAACYKLLPVVHRLWKRVQGEDDDYIAQPKASGYQSLHTAVMGPGGVPMEVQIRTASMHDVAEYGRAAHWAYKERPPAAVTTVAAAAAAAGAPDRADIVPGHPMLRISPGGELGDGVVVETEAEGMRLLVAVSWAPRRFASAQPTKAAPAEYAALLEYVSDKGFFSPGQGDLVASLELFTLCGDGKYHRRDQFGHKLPTVAVPLVREPVVEEGEVVGLVDSSEDESGDEEKKQRSDGADDAAYMNNRIRLLRSMLEWGEDMGSQLPSVDGEDGGGAVAVAVVAEPTGPVPNLAFERSPQDVMVLVWPSGKILRVPRGTTAGTVAQREGGGTTGVRRRRGVVNVNNRLVPEGTSLEDGDYVVLTQEGVKV